MTKSASKKTTPTLVANDVTSWKAVGGWLAYMVNNRQLHLTGAGPGGKPELVDDSTMDFELTSELLVFRRTDGTLHVVNLTEATRSH